MAKASIHTLVIEDNPADVLFLQEALEKDALTNFHLVISERLAQGLEWLRRQPFDVLLLDLGLPDSQGLATFDQVHRLFPSLPVVVLSGLIDEEMAVQAVQAGAQDYLVKGTTGWEILARAIRYAIERQQTQATLRANEARFRALIEHSSDAIALLDDKCMILYQSPSIAKVLGYNMNDLVSHNVMTFLHPEDRAASMALFEEVLQKPHTPLSGQMRYQHKDGSWRWIEGTGTNLLDEPDVHAIVVNYRDITERKQAEEAQAKLEAQLRQAQKMESIGRLAGGVAHDFNNLLTVIQGYCTFIQAQIPLGHPMHEDVEQIRLASERATALTRQLLAFSRKQILSPTVLDLNQLIIHLHKMLERIIGEDILLSTVLEPGLWPITADLGQIEQVLLNLVVNARDAMPTGGLLTIETHNTTLDTSYARTYLDTPDGPCVMLAITDTGCGMEEQVQAQIFEPFFTTKAPGEGTGLGLATVYGIIKQSGGNINVYSEPGKGTTFRIYLPVSATASTSEAVPAQLAPRDGHETILLVEDEEQVRRLARRILQSRGYVVLEASHGQEAVSICGEHEGPIDLLVTDVVMPQISGRLLAEHLKTLRPQMKILFISGYTDDTVFRHGLLEAEVAFLAKPFSPVTLASKVREVLTK